MKKIIFLMTCGLILLTAADKEMRVAPGQTAPGFLVGVYQLEGESYNNNRFNISSLYGKKPVVLSFFTKDCESCKVEIAEFMKIKEKYEKKGIAIYLVLIKTSQDKNEKELLKDISKRDYTFPILYYPYPKTVFPNYIKTKNGAISSFPLTYFINKAGKIVKIKHGFNRENPEGEMAVITKLLNTL